MKSKITITLVTDTEKVCDGILTQIGLLLIKNKDNTEDYEIEYQKNIENKGEFE